MCTHLFKYILKLNVNLKHDRKERERDRAIVDDSCNDAQFLHVNVNKITSSFIWTLQFAWAMPLFFTRLLL